MPRITLPFTIDISPERFLHNCSREELIETDLLLQSNYYQALMNGKTPDTEVRMVRTPIVKE